MPIDAKPHRLIAVADLAGEISASWVADQAVPEDVQLQDPGGLYDRLTSGAQGFECACLWLDGDGEVVDDDADVGLRPAVLWTVEAPGEGQGSPADGTRVLWAAEAQEKPPGLVLSFEDSRPSRTWLKVTAATAPGGATHLAILTRSVP